MLPFDIRFILEDGSRPRKIESVIVNAGQQFNLKVSSKVVGRLGIQMEMTEVGAQTSRSINGDWRRETWNRTAGIRVS